MAPRTVFGTTWWGAAWVSALENAAMPDPNRLSRGRTYARNGSVGELTIAAGHISARVIGSHRRYYRVDIAVRTLAPTEWEQVAEAIAAKAAHAAALLDGELDPGIVDDVAQVDVRLLPGAGDLRPDCSCPDWAEPCKHEAAVCYLVAAELDRDPFVLFLLRGMARDDLMAMVREQRGGRAIESVEPPTPKGVRAASAWGRQPLDAPLEPLPEIVTIRDANHHRSSRHTPWEAEIPRGHRVDTTSVDDLAIDAALRAQAMLTDGRPSGLRANSRADVARRAAGLDRGPAVAQLAERLGLEPTALRRWADAWTLGGDHGVAMVADPNAWSTDSAALEAGRDALVDLGYARRSIALNYDSLRMKANVWLALGFDGRWYRLQGRGKSQELQLAVPPSIDVCDLVELPE